MKHIEPYIQRNLNRILTSLYRDVKYLDGDILKKTKSFIDNGADVNYVSTRYADCGYTPLMFAVTNKRLDNIIDKIVDLFIESGYRLDNVNEYGEDIFSLNPSIEKYVKFKFPVQYEEYLINKNSKKYNL
jgi:ankyrin repeat protein